MFCANKSPVHTPTHTPTATPSRSRANSLDNTENNEDRARQITQILMDSGFIENTRPVKKSIKVTKIKPVKQ
jgi:hypothetical protein